MCNISIDRETKCVKRNKKKNDGKKCVTCDETNCENKTENYI